MGTGFGVLLLILGAVTVFTTLDNNLVKGGLDVVGWILMAGGLLSIVLALVMNRQRATTRHTAVVDTRSVDHDIVEEHRVVRERRPDDPVN